MVPDTKGCLSLAQHKADHLRERCLLAGWGEVEADLAGDLIFRAAVIAPYEFGYSFLPIAARSWVNTEMAAFEEDRQRGRHRVELGSRITGDNLRRIYAGFNWED